MSSRKQYAALPYVRLADRVEICLITSRATGRWIIPKGWPQDGLAPHQLAALEACEEAGLKGGTGSRAGGPSLTRPRRLDPGDPTPAT